MSDDIGFKTAVELLAAYRQKELSPVEATEAVLDQISRHGNAVNAFALVDEEAALAAAAASEARWVRGETLGPLDGIPTTVKDSSLTRGWPTLVGSRSIDPAQPWDEDAPYVTRLRDAGAVLIGKTTTPEYCWKGVTDSSLNGITRNPWDLSRTAGGSSGGAGAALAAGMCTLALGTDAGGSIRIPASFCGVFGLKPTFGRVALHHTENFSSLSVVGPMTRSVIDAALLMNVICQPEDRDWSNLPSNYLDYLNGLDEGVANLRIAFSPTLGYASQLNGEVSDCVARAVNLFVTLGAVVEERDPSIDWPIEIYNTIAWAEQSYLLGPIVEKNAAIMDPGLVEIVHVGSGIDENQYFGAVAKCLALSHQMSLFYRDFDLLVTPTLPVTAFKADRYMPKGNDPRKMNDWLPFSSVFNLSRQPAATVPCGFATNGLPIGLQIVGPMYGETLVLRAARAFEHARNGVGYDYPMTNRAIRRVDSGG
jgi:aspartyl-tRNA(Asn)/glutamyl-tRNA(Gln) amidotransferase subunit A